MLIRAEIGVFRSFFYVLQLKFEPVTVPRLLNTKEGRTGRDVEKLYNLVSLVYILGIFTLIGLN